MRRILLGLLSIFISTAALADDKDKLLGTWKLVAFVLEDAETKEKKALFGEHPMGYFTFLPNGRTTVILTAEGRSMPRNDAERAAAFQSMTAYSGQYRLEGNKLVVDVDVAWNAAWVGTSQTRTIKLDRDKLDIISATQPNPNFGGRMMTGLLGWERVK